MNDLDPTTHIYQLCKCVKYLTATTNLIILVKKNQGKQWGLRFKIFGDFFFFGLLLKIHFPSLNKALIILLLVIW
jgi:hypothetical protein